MAVRFLVSPFISPRVFVSWIKPNRGKYSNLVFAGGFGLVLDVVLGTGFGKFWEGENHGFGLTPPTG